MILARLWKKKLKQNGIFVNIIIKRTDTLINFPLLYRIGYFKRFFALHSEHKHFGLANIIFYCNMSLVKIVIYDISATLEKVYKMVFLLT